MCVCVFRLTWWEATHWGQSCTCLETLHVSLQRQATILHYLTASHAIQHKPIYIKYLKQHLNKTLTKYHCINSVMTNTLASNCCFTSSRQRATLALICPLFGSLGATVAVLSAYFQPFPVPAYPLIWSTYCLGLRRLYTVGLHLLLQETMQWD